jgi:hypothetical protein
VNHLIRLSKQINLQFFGGTDNVEGREDVADTGEALVCRSDDLHDASDDPLRRVRVQDAVSQRLHDADGAIGTVALCNIKRFFCYKDCDFIPLSTFATY